MHSEFATDHTTLESFFFSEIERAQSERCDRLPTDVEAYVVGLLARYATCNDVAGRTARPLAIDYLEARNERGAQRAHALRDVGDRALYISGVVPRSLARSPVGVRYIRGIGKAAYESVATSNESSLRVFHHIAERFAHVASVIGEVARTDDRDDLLHTYERWRREGDEQDLARLVAAGVLIDPERSDLLQ